MSKLKLNKAIVEGLEPAGSQYLVRDTEVPGFFVMVGARTKTWMIQIDVKDALTGKTKTRRMTLGRFPDVGVAEARRLAEEARIEARKGVAPSKGKTLAEAWEDLRRELVADKASPRTVEGYEYGMSLLTDWADTPLLKLANARGDIRRRWNDIKAQIGDGAANSFVKTLRRIYRHAMTMDDALPPTPPTFGLKVKTLRAKDTTIKKRPISLSTAKIAEWKRALDAQPSGVKRTFWWFMLHSGARVGALSRAKWNDLDVKNRVLRIPDDKTGRYDIPLTREMLRTLARARREGKKLNAAAAQTYIWPADPARSKGKPLLRQHLWEPTPAGGRAGLPLYNHDLRRSYELFCKEAGVPKEWRNVLTNHGDEDMGDLYVNRSDLDQRMILSFQQKVTDHIKAALVRPA